MKKPDIYMLLLRIPHFRTRIYLSDLWNDLSNFYEVLDDSWFEYRFKRQHRFIADMSTARCSCGHEYGSSRLVSDKDIDIHKDMAREEAWDNRRRWR